MAATGQFTVNTSYAFTSTTGSGGTITDSESIAYSATNATSGTAAGQIDKTWSQATSTLTATTVTLTLSALSGPLGSTVAFVVITEISIFNDAATASNTLTVGGATNPLANLFGDAASDKIKIPAGGCFCITAPIEGFAVTASTADKLKLDSGAGTVPYRIVIKGRSA